MSSTLIRGGLVVDGTGRAAFPADVLVEGDRIADVVERSGRAALPRGLVSTEIDASGCLVTPGFIDAHAHSDAYLVVEPGAPSKISQGITTEINGQSGGSVAPRLVLEACFAAGARLARRGEFTERAFLNGRMDLSEAEGVIELVDAKTGRAARDALSRQGGAAGKAYRAMYDRALSLGDA